MKFIPGEREIISDNGEKVMESTYSGHIECRSERFDLDFKVPVWDVRDGGFDVLLQKKNDKEYTKLVATGARKKANESLSRGSKYFNNPPKNMITKGERAELNKWRGF